MRSPIVAARFRARHRGKTTAQLRAECDDLVCTVVRLTAENDRLRAAYTRLEADFDAAAIDYSGALYDKQQAEQCLAAGEGAPVWARGEGVA